MRLIRIFLFLLFICPSAFAAYTEMVIEGVQQSNGVWTTAGVMDTQGFVRTTGAVTVSGVTRNLPVTMTADRVAASAIMKSAARLAGPVALAAAAYDVYQWVTTDTGIQASGNQWIEENPDVWAVGSYWGRSATSCIASNPQAVADCTGVALYGAGNYGTQPCTVSIPNQQYYCVVYPTYNPAAHFPINANKYTCTTQNVASCKDAVYAGEDYFNLKTGIPPLPILASGWNNIPSLKGKGIPFTEATFTPYSEWKSDPYFKDGNWWRDRMDVSPAPTPSQPTRVRVDYGPVKLEGMTDPTVKPDDTPASENTQPKEQTKFCDDNPQSIACVELGQLEDEPTTLDERPFHITPESPWGQGSASCPNPETETLRTGATVTFSYQPTCDFFSSIRPAVIAVAFLAALYIALGIPAGKGN
ncbi:virulence factor TspB C-terminal domain-related protein [Aeromonas caviae]|uniref:virulence factor TspB C-terminal domain-related protein n=1 Tax=Aeromonas caviae TaxID=648 RepID=UPI0029D4BCFE|nr:virulence factor TspB C-terminal domain-related protein [Aeromonas caviae]MDX7728754.1 virulence factor TspB C-terminal domain-related protein [Aeromonas caviae]